MINKQNIENRIKLYFLDNKTMLFKCFLLWIIWSFSRGQVTAQKAPEDFKKINLTYQENSTFSMEVDYKVYKNWVTETVLQSEKGMVKNANNKSYFKIGKVENIKTPTYQLIADHEDKNIAIMSIYGDSPEAINVEGDAFLFNLKKLFKMCEKVIFKKVNSEQNSYEIIFPKGFSEYEKVKIYYNQATYFIEKMVLYYGLKQNLEDPDDEENLEKPRIEMTYSNINTNPSFTKNTFSYSKYVIKKGDSVILRENYKGYTLTDKLGKN